MSGIEAIAYWLRADGLLAGEAWVQFVPSQIQVSFRKADSVAPPTSTV